MRASCTVRKITTDSEEGPNGDLNIRFVLLEFSSTFCDFSVGWLLSMDVLAAWLLNFFHHSIHP